MVTIKTPEEIEIMDESGKILASVIERLGKEVKPGVTTRELDQMAEKLILENGDECSFKNYNVPDDSSQEEAYPNCLCTSINEEIVHAIPSDRFLKEGDIISLDLGLKHKGFHSDMAKTFAVGKIDSQTQKLLEVTEKSLYVGIEKMKPGNLIGDISKAVQKYIEDRGFNVVRELCGHGIGRNVHEDPEVLNSISFDRIIVDRIPYQGDAKIKLKEGMVLCVEPMATIGDWHIKRSADGFGFETIDGSLSCHFEHTIAITKDGYRILTKI
jgi:methionyl aminopeptidase